MAANNSKPRTKQPGRSDRLERMERTSREFMQARSDAFGRAMNRKGMPMTWGTGTPRTDAAWRRDQEYESEP